MIDKAKQLGYGAILFFGRPEYYPQFRFQEASLFGITDSDGYNYPAKFEVAIHRLLTSVVINLKMKGLIL